VAASDDFAVSTEDAVTHQECLFITSNICMQGAQYLEKWEEMLSCFEDFITFCSLLHFTYWSQQKGYLLELCEELPTGATWWLSAEQCNKIKSVTAGHFK
jgi:hypothetical protein